MRLCELVSRLYVRGGQLGGRRFRQTRDMLRNKVLLPWKLLVLQIERERLGRSHPFARVRLQQMLRGQGRALLAMLLYHIQVPNLLQFIYVIVIALTYPIRIKSNLRLHELNIRVARLASFPLRGVRRTV